MSKQIGIVIPVTGPVQLDVDVSALEALQKAVGGYIEFLGLYRGDDDDCVGTAYVDEDGIAKGLPHNERATKLCDHFKVGLQQGDYIKGPMVILGPGDDDGNSTSIREDVQRECLTLCAFVGEQQA